jgi:hypothetical protein
VLLFVCFDVYSPGEFGKIATAYLASKLSITGIDLRYISTIVWLLLMVFSIRYFQLNINLDRQYDYLHQLEEVLSGYFPVPAFTREGKSYLKVYPLFSDWVHHVYTIGIPILLIAVAIVRLIGTVRMNWPWSAFEFIDLAITLTFIVSISFYIISVHFPKKERLGSTSKCNEREWLR